MTTSAADSPGTTERPAVRPPRLRIAHAGAATCAGLALLAALPPASALGATARAQPAEPDVYEGRPIRAVVVRTPAGLDADGNQAFRPLEGPNRQRTLNNIRTYPGSAFRRETVNDDIRRLNRLGRFATVESLVQLLEDGSVDVYFTLVERPIVQDVQSSGNIRISDQEIAATIDLIPGIPIDRFQVDRAARRIEDLYRERGYYLARVGVDERELTESGIVLFQIREGERVKVKRIHLIGNYGFSDTRLARELATKPAGPVVSIEGETNHGPLSVPILEPLLRKGELDDDLITEDLNALRAFYRDEGYLDVRADYQIQFSPNGREAILEYIIDEGPLYVLRSLQLVIEDGEPVFTEAQLQGLIDLKPGDVYAARSVRDAAATIQRAYGKLGYSVYPGGASDGVDVSSAEKRDPDRPIVDLVLTIRQGQRYKVGEVIIQGNELTRDEVIRREALDVRPERPLDPTEIARTRDRIRRTRLFNTLTPEGVKITLQPPDPAEPEYRDVLIEVEETNTGSFNIGGAINSDAGLTGRIELIQRNFDIADTPDTVGEFTSGRAFRGGGQTFEIRLVPGDQVQDYRIGVTEPHLFDTNYSGSVTAFFRDRDFDEFDEQRFGLRGSIGRRFGTRWNGSLGLRAESIELGDLPDDVPIDVFQVEDQNVLFGVGLSLQRSSLDNIFRPTRGSRASIGVEQVFGDFEFTRFDAGYRVFVPVREDLLGRSTVLSFSTDIGYIPQGQEDVPTYERFYLGGQSFRGLDFRTVSPRSVRADNGQPSDDPVGGTWLFFAGAQITQPIFEEVFSVVGFVDTGTVTFDPGFEDYRVTAGVGLRFYVAALSPAPLAFDFGFPVIKEDDDETRLFTFSIDLPF